MRQARSPTSKAVTLDAALSPAINRLQVASTPLPSGVTIPKPVTTTRRIALSRTDPVICNVRRAGSFDPA
jgi:hypothetical protein